MLRKPNGSASLPGWLPPFNRVVVALGRLGVAIGPVHVLTLPGRRTGEPRPAPVSPFVLDGRRYVVAALPQADWARNARGPVVASCHAAAGARRWPSRRWRTPSCAGP